MSDDLTACAQLVQSGDPDRFLATMAAPPAARAILFPLYAFNVEISRAPWVTQEPMIAEMRLQWWRDALEEMANGARVRRHEVTTPLAAALAPNAAKALDAAVAARRWDIYSDPFEDQAAFDAHINATAGTLLWVAASTLGQVDETALRDIGYAQGVANWLRAIPELEARGRIPLLDGTPTGVRALALCALDRLARARPADISRAARPALLAAWEARALLTLAARDPSAVIENRLAQSPARKRLSLMLKSATGRW